MLPEHFEKKSAFTNKNILYLFNRTIYEYDMHSADISLIEYYKLLPNKEIEKIRSLDKQRRVVYIGKKRKDAEFSKKLNDAFEKMRAKFYEENNLDLNDIISVKKDAIFTTKLCEKTTFKTVEFQVKNIYSSFMQLKNLEFYYSPEKLDVKGIDDEILKLHEDGMMKILRTYFKKMETGTVQDVVVYLNRICSRYKLRDLSVDFYREFNTNSKFNVIGTEDQYNDYWEDKKNELDISYNFTTILIPLVKIAI
jgi:hypothetical protein